MDLGTAASLLLGGGLLGSLLTWQVARANHKLAREKHDAEQRAEKRQRLGDLYRQTDAYLLEAWRMAWRVTNYTTPEDAGKAGIHMFDGLKLESEWRVEQMPAVADALHEVAFKQSFLVLRGLSDKFPEYDYPRHALELWAEELTSAVDVTRKVLDDLYTGPQK